jgi:ribosomal protein S18 acetylase RimI-like enzyme
MLGVMDLVIRPCAPEDAYEVESLRVAGWRAAYRGIIPGAYLDGLPVDGERRRRLMTERGAEYSESVAVGDGEIVGWVAAGPPRDEDLTGPGHGEVYACYVRPDCWGRGVGRRLMDHALGQLAGEGRTSVTLWVLEDNRRARRFYESCGMRPDGARKLLDFGEPVAEIRYLLTLPASASQSARAGEAATRPLSPRAAQAKRQSR